MSSLLTISKVPRCFSCLHRAFAIQIAEVASPFRIQLRGKKKLSKVPATVKVRLLRDIRGWGRQGSIVPVAPGRMRNIWYPRKKAQYVTDAQLQNMKDVVIERDPLFGMEEIADEQDAQVEIEMRLLSPQRASQIIASHVPDYIKFYRSPISTPEPERPKVESPKRNYKSSASTAAADLAAASESASKPESKAQPVAIYGSVSTADIAASITALLNLAATSEGIEEAARVVLNAEDIAIVRDGEEDPAGDVDRIKSLGDYVMDIRVKGGPSVRKMVRVEAQESKPLIRYHV